MLTWDTDFERMNLNDGITSFHLVPPHVAVFFRARARAVCVHAGEVCGRAGGRAGGRAYARACGKGFITNIVS